MDPLDAAFAAPKEGDSFTPEQLAQLKGQAAPASVRPKRPKAALNPRRQPQAQAAAQPDPQAQPQDPGKVLADQLDAAFSAPKTGETLAERREPDHSGPAAAFKPAQEPGHRVPPVFPEIRDIPPTPARRSFWGLKLAFFGAVLGLFLVLTHMDLFSLLAG